MTLRANKPRLTAGVSLLLSFGCGAGHDEAPTPDGFEQVPGYSSERVLSWGSTDSTDAAFFFNVVGTYRLGEHIAVVEEEEPRVRYFTESGDVVSDAGEGSGPGEYSRIVSAARLPGDSLFVYDSNLARASVLDARGAFARFVRLTGSSRAYFVRGAPMISADGHLEGVAVKTASFRPAGLGEPGPNPDTESILYFDAAGRFRRELGSVADTFWWNDSRGRPVLVPMRKAEVWAPARGRLVVGFGTADELSSVDAGGDWTLLYKGGALRRLTNDERATVVEALAQEHVAPQSIRRAAQVTNRPREVPPYAHLVAGDSGQLWLGDYRDPLAPGRRWRILDSSGAPVATAMLPSRFRATDVRGEMAYGVTVDEIGTEKIEAYQILR